MRTLYRIRMRLLNLWQSWYSAFTWPTFALPVDGFRVLVGLLSFVYFCNLIREVPDISSPDGLIDHALLQNIFWYIRWSLFQPGMAAWHFYVLFVLGLFAAEMVIVGWHSKWAVAYLYLVVVSTYRWNFLVVYLDDSLMHLALAWLLLLPIGRTLTLPDWLKHGRQAWARWKQEVVPGPAVYCFLANLALIYLVAGMWKWTSPMWLDGSALYAGLKMPTSLAPDFWRPEYLPVLRLFNYAGLVLEPILALVVVLPKRHPLKWLLVAGALGFHGGIILTLRIPYANSACLFGLVLVVRDEIMDFLRSPVASLESRPPTLRLDGPGKLAFTLVILLTLAMIGDTLPWWVLPAGLSRQAGPDGVILAPGQVLGTWRSRHNASNAWGKLAAQGNPFHLPLWFAGLGQQYRLFDWIDDVAYTGNYEILEAGEPPIIGRAAAQRLFPNTSRGAALQAYVNDVRWIIIPLPWPTVVKQSLFERLARRYCQTYAPRHPVDVFVAVEKITTDNLQLNQGHRERLMTFECKDGEPSMTYMRILN